MHSGEIPPFYINIWVKTNRYLYVVCNRIKLVKHLQHLKETITGYKDHINYLRS